MLRYLTLLLFVAAGCSAGVPREKLGREVKLTVLVDKVMQPVAGWKTEEWMVREAAEAGFNVYSPRHGYEDLEAVRRVSEWCAKYGIYHLVWMRGTLTAPEGAESDGRRLVWPNGGEQLLWSPNSDAFWEWTTRYIIEYAKISRELPSLLGVFLDYENYAPGAQNNCYELSYDLDILRRFAAAKQVELPELQPAERRQWLVDKGLHDAFEAYQVDHWRERCRTLRQAVDRLDPKFQFCIYPAPGTPFMVRACYPEWTTKAAPIILADPWTYGRASRFAPQERALQKNREILERGLQIPREAGIPYIYIGGIDPVVGGADPEFSGKNAVMCSEVTDGYWIFYEGPTYTKDDHKQYFKWFRWANEAIAAGRLTAWHAPRETPEDWSIPLVDTGDGSNAILAPPVTGEAVDFPVVKLRGENLLVLPLKKGLKAEIVLRSVPFGKSPDPLEWELRDATFAALANGKIDHDAEGTVSFVPPADGIYLLAASSGRCAWSPVRANVPVGLLAAHNLHLVLEAGPLYFKVPAGERTFTVHGRGWGPETLKLTIRDARGEVLAEAQSTPTEAGVKLTPKTAAGAASETWSLTVGKADQGVLEDYTLTLQTPLPPVLSLVPSQAFGFRPAG